MSYDAHECGVCFQSMLAHDARCYFGETDDWHSHWSPLCCPGCGCQSFEEGHGLPIHGDKLRWRRAEFATGRWHHFTAVRWEWDLQAYPMVGSLVVAGERFDRVMRADIWALGGRAGVLQVRRPGPRGGLKWRSLAPLGIAA